MWERACSRMQCVSQHIHWLIHRIREQARSHIFDRVRLPYPVKPAFCGSWLASDANNSVHQAHPVDAIAGKPAPTV
ncbi:hypothetical protein EJJ20_20610 [Pseudomonas poae]|nr:hypothetical protein EJJ20_20610 [Pseudomonas poae]